MSVSPIHDNRAVSLGLAEVTFTRLVLSTLCNRCFFARCRRRLSCGAELAAVLGPASATLGDGHPTKWRAGCSFLCSRPASVRDWSLGLLPRPAGEGNSDRSVCPRGLFQEAFSKRPFPRGLFQEAFSKRPLQSWPVVSPPLRSRTRQQLVGDDLTKGEGRVVVFGGDDIAINDHIVRNGRRITD